MKKRYFVLLFFLALGIIYALGPRPEFPEFDAQIQPISIPLEQLDKYLLKKESKVTNIKPENEARIIWADSIRKTPYSIVYLHGFSASAAEGRPVHQDIAQKYGFNLYLSRLAQHGINDKESFKDLSPKALIDSAKEAIAIGKLLGEKVIVMSCSTGSTLSAYLAAYNSDWIDVQLMISPNFEINSSTVKLITKPWGEHLAYAVNGKYRKLGMPEHCYPYWTEEYRVEGVIALQALLDATMTDAVFSKIQQPTFVGYYYKNEEERDHVISMEAIHHFMETIETPKAQKKAHAFPDAGFHVFISDLRTQNFEQPKQEIYAFLDAVLE